MQSVNDIQASRLPVKYAYLDKTTAAIETVVAGVTGKKIRLLSVTAIATTATTIMLSSNATAKSPTFPVGATGGFTARGVGHYGLMETVAGEALRVTLGGAVATGIWVTYLEV